MKTTKLFCLICGTPIELHPKERRRCHHCGALIADTHAMVLGETFEVKYEGSAACLIWREPEAPAVCVKATSENKITGHIEGFETEADELILRIRVPRIPIRTNTKMTLIVHDDEPEAPAEVESDES